MSHHFDAPGLEPPILDPAVARVHVSDLYAFGKPRDAETSVLIMTVNPLAVADSFDPAAVYELKVDANGDAVAETAFRVMFSGGTGDQTATLRRADGEAAAGTARTSSPTRTSSASRWSFRTRRSPKRRTWGSGRGSRRRRSARA